MEKYLFSPCSIVAGAMWEWMCYIARLRHHLKFFGRLILAGISFVLLATEFVLDVIVWLLLSVFVRLPRRLNTRSFWAGIYIAAYLGFIPIVLIGVTCMPNWDPINIGLSSQSSLEQFLTRACYVDFFCAAIALGALITGKYRYSDD